MNSESRLPPIKLISIFVLIHVITACTNNTEPDKNVLVAHLEDDIKSFLDRAEEVHPNLYLYVSREELLNGAKDDIKSVCPGSSCSSDQQKIVLSRFIRRIGTDHVFLPPDNKKLPVQLYKENEKYFIYNLSTSASHEVDSVNGRNLDEIWAELKSITSRLNTNIERSYISWFSSYSLPWVLSSKSVIFSGGSKNYAFHPVFIKKEKLLIRPGRDYTYIKIPSMSDVDLGKIRIEIGDKKNQNLIVDLRENPGGSVASTAKLFEMLTGKNGFKNISPYKGTLIRHSKVLTKLKRDRIGVLWPLYSAFFECGYKDSYYYLDEKTRLSGVCEDVEANSRVKEIGYVEKIYVIIDGGTGSAAAVLAGMLKNDGAQVYGQVAHGNEERNFGNPIAINMKYTNLNIAVPTTYTNRSPLSERVEWPTKEFSGVKPNVKCSFGECMKMIVNSILEGG